MKSIAWNIQDEWQPLEAVMVGIGAGMGPVPKLEDTYDPQSRKHVEQGTYPRESDVIRELDAFADALQAHAVQIKRPETLGFNQVFARAEVDRESVRTAPILLDDPRERALAIRLLAFPTAIDATLETYSPHKLANYAYDLATDFTSFYEHCPIVRSDEPTRTSRLALADLTARVLERSLGLLGIDAPERM